jgi:hypothetical protein
MVADTHLQQRQRAKRTAIVLALIALGFYLALFAKYF